MSGAFLDRLALARGDIDRAAERRSDDAWLASVWADPRTRALVVSDGRFRVTGGSGVAWQSTTEMPAGDRLFLGLVDGVAHFAVLGDSAEPNLAGWANLREVGADLTDADAGLCVSAVALANWHAAHQRCPRCGAPTRPTQAGWVRQCVEDDSQHFPRTDPAVIALVIDDADRALLGRQVVWPEGFFSTLAGFVEPGESAEAAVRREVREESGVDVGELTYLGSQPWPFPCSIMLGYHAAAIPGSRIQVDGTEIAEARWFTRDGLVDACRAGEVRLPSRVSIARRLVEAWFGAELPGEWSRP